MKKEVKILLGKAINSLVLSIEHFNRPSEMGRVETVLILLDHAFEMFLKSAILHRRGKIREPRAKQTIGFDQCVRKVLSNNEIRFLTKEQALTLQIINSLRDAAQHHLLDISEQHLYLHAQAGVTLFRDLYKKVFLLELSDRLPSRVLPLSTDPLTDIATLFSSEADAIKKLLRPGSRHKLEAAAKLRALAIFEGALQGERVQPGKNELRKLGKQILAGKRWSEVFPGVASIEITQKGYGPSFDLRITKKQGMPIHIVPEGTPDATVVAVRKIDKLGFYNMGLNDLAKNMGLSPPKTLAYIWSEKVQEDRNCFAEIAIGRSRYKRYSQKAIDEIKQAMKSSSVDEVWRQYKSKKASK